MAGGCWWGSMFRIISVLIATTALAACGGGAEFRARHQAMVDANKIPDVQLTPEQIATLKANTPLIRRDEIQIAWVGAGRQNDGTTFVCYVTKTQDLFRVQEHIGVYTGAFQADGSFKPSAVPLLGEGNPVHNCWAKGFSPPVRQNVTVVPMRI
jgi:hypothetical protein